MDQENEKQEVTTAEPTVEVGDSESKQDPTKKKRKYEMSPKQVKRNRELSALRMERMKERRKLEADEKQRMEVGFKRLCFFSESYPGVPCANFGEELQVQREWARELNIEDVKTGETLRQFVERVWQAWINGPYTCRNIKDTNLVYAPLFDRLNQKFSENFGNEFDVRSISKWYPPDGDTGGPLVRSNLPYMGGWDKKESKQEQKRPQTGILATDSSQVPASELPRQFDWRDKDDL